MSENGLVAPEEDTVTRQRVGKHVCSHAKTLKEDAESKVVS
jgi:hypothetical protein